MPQELAYAILTILGLGLLAQLVCAVYLVKANRRLNAIHRSQIATSATMQGLMKEHTSELQRARLRAR